MNSKFIEMLLSYISKYADYLKYNESLFDIYEGNLLPYVEKDLKCQLSLESYAQAKHRISPINVLTKIIDKLSKIYQQNPTREVIDGNESDSELLTWYEKTLDFNSRMNAANEFFNLFKTCLVQPLVDEKNLTPFLRIIPSDRFLPFSVNKVNPIEPTHIIIFDGKQTAPSGQEVTTFTVYDDFSFVTFDTNGDIRPDIMAMNSPNNPQGINQYGKLPFVYVNKSINLLVPKSDTDILRMTKLLPVILSDLNYATMYSCFSILYGIDIDNSNIKMAPNAFWTFNSLGDGEKKPELGVIKPQVDIEQVLNLVQSQLSFWLNTKGIRPGAVGQLTAETFSSGISKMIDEMDTFEARQEQVTYFTAAEGKIWDLILNYMHPVWVKNGLIENTALFTPSAHVETKFSEQLPLISRKDLVATLKEEVAAGFTTREIAIKKLNPEMTDKQIEELIADIEGEREVQNVASMDEAPMAKDGQPNPDAMEGMMDDGTSGEENE